MYIDCTKAIIVILIPTARDLLNVGLEGLPSYNTNIYQENLNLYIILYLYLIFIYWLVKIIAY